MKAGVARRCLDAGAAIVNDVTGLTADADMPAVVAAAGAGVVVMHMQGTPQTMQLNPTYGDVVGDGRVFMPRNAFNEPNAASLATGGGMSSNIYSGGIFELAADEALIVELHQPVEPNYIGFCLGNLWGESLDFANHQSSLNGLQAQRDPDNVIRCVIAHVDPGVHNWLDTTGHPEGYMCARWAYSVKPKENLPRATAKKVRVEDVMRHLPATTRRVTPEERRAAIAVRQEHVQRRYRHH